LSPDEEGELQFLSGEEENWPSSLKNFLVEDFLGVFSCTRIDDRKKRKKRFELGFL
jgi:hypothetical protein